ncbi:uncharacterized protein [Amphiura filiformis]|uniref:uncharacterized protein isoform X2 n=1 Tax=Amphiura filiformis TaxID=82378 RepID=UPI003B2201C8
MPVQEGQPNSRHIRPIPGINCLSYAIIIFAFGTSLLGTVAIVSKTRIAYLGDPIWTGVLNISFLLMTILSTIASIQLSVFSIFAITHEFNIQCFPYPGSSSSYYSSDVVNTDTFCFPQWTRVFLDVAITVCACIVLILNIISFCLTTYGTCTCCRGCCNDASSPTTASNTGQWMQLRDEHVTQETATATSIPTQCHNPVQPNSPLFMVVTPNGSPQSTNQIPQPVYIMQPATNINPPQPQVYVVSNYQQAQQSAQQPTHGLSSEVINQQIISPTL